MMDSQAFIRDDHPGILANSQTCARQFLLMTIVWVANLYTMMDSQAFIRDDHLGILANAQTCARQTVFAYDKQKTFLKLARKSACQGMFVWVANLYTMKNSQALTTRAFWPMHKHVLDRQFLLMIYCLGCQSIHNDG